MKLRTRSVLLVMLYIGITTPLFAQSLFINEFLASNNATYDDEYGEFDDWIEIYNAGSTPVDLGGMYLTDNLSDPTKLQIPTGNPSSTTLAAGEFFVFWFDGQPEQGIFHVDAKLKASGEQLGLWASDGLTVIDSFTYGAQTVDISQGRQPDGSSSWNFFSTPTPGSENDTPGSINFVAMPTASKTAGYYAGTQSVILSTTTPGAEIRFTTNGDEPQSSSSLYTTPLSIDETTTLRARAFKTNMFDSRVMTHTYLYNVDHDFPVVCLSTDDDNFFDSDDGIYENYDEDLERPVHVEFFEPDSSLAFKIDMGVKIHGSGSASLPQKSLALTARSSYGANKINYQIFPDLNTEEFGSVVLRSSGQDWNLTMFRDAVSSSLVRDLSDVGDLILEPRMYNQGYRPTVVYLNGNYFGIHNLREKMDWRYVDSYFGLDKDDIDVIDGRDDVEQGSVSAWEEFYDFVEDHDFSEETNFDSLKTWLEVDHFLDYNIFQIYIDNHDWPMNNNKRWRERASNGKWRWLTYDLDFSTGLYTDGGWNSGDFDGNALARTLAPNSVDWPNASFSTLILRRCMENASFKQDFINRLADQLNVLYQPTRFVNRINQFENTYLPESAMQQDLWSNFYGWDDDIDKLRNFANGRVDAVRDHVVEEFSEVSGIADVDLNVSPAAAGKILFSTLNLTPVNLPFSGIYFEQIDIPIQAIPARGYLFDSWTTTENMNDDAQTVVKITNDASITANFVQGATNAAPIVINEINYNSPDNTNSGDWLELYNNSATAVDLSAWYFEDESGDYFGFPAGTIMAPNAYLVLVEDRTNFQAIYPTINDLVGDFGNSLVGSFKLSNKAEILRLYTANGTLVDSVRYQDDAPWPEAADGDGPTLQLIDADLDNALASSWIATYPTPNAANCRRLTQNQLPSDLVTGLSITNVSCGGETDGAINLMTIGGGLDYRWNNNVTSEDLEDVAAGTYEVLVLSETNCENIVDLTIATPAPITTTAQFSAEICHAANDGTINLSNAGGTGTYTYQWNSGATTASLNNLSANNYNVTITDAMNCQVIESYEITAAPEIVLTEDIANLSCFDTQDGSIELEATGGSSGFNYLWNTNATTATINNLAANNYSVTVTDAINCIVVESFELTAPTALSLTEDVNNPNCFGEESGSIAVSVAGGTGSYTYLWSNAATTALIDDLATDSYTITITDAANCTYVESFEITSPTMLEVEAAVATIACHDNSDGQISLNVTGGTDAYTYLWNTDATTSLIDGLAADTYSVTITDAANCKYVESFEITSPSMLEVEAEVATIACHDNTDGQISLSVTGGTSGYTYLWNTNATTSLIDDLGADTYSVTITDAANCTNVESFEITSPSMLEVEAEVATIACHDNSDGQISLNVTGGTSGYTYLWNTNATTSLVDNLAADNYTVTITDAANCSTVESFQLTAPVELSLMGEVNNNDCFGAESGSIAVSVAGGTGAYTYLWSNAATTSMIDALAEDTYTVTVTDAANCTYVESFEITTPSILAVEASIQTIICPGNADGQIALNVTGGTNAYTYLWNTNATTSMIEELVADTYTVTITDAANCQRVESYEVTSTEMIAIAAMIDTILCNGANDGSISLEVTGGNNDYTYLWNTNATTALIDGLIADAYTVTITDGEGCEAISSFEITEAEVLAVEANTTNIACNGEENGAIELIPMGGAGTYTYLWNTGLTTASLTNLAANNYAVTITDAANCEVIESYEILEPTALTLLVEEEDISCFAGMDGSINLLTSGGTGAYNYVWSNGATTAMVNALPANEYTVTITDAANCSFIQNITLTQAPAIAETAVIDHLDCFGDTDGNIVVTGSGGTGNLVYTWDNMESGNSLENLSEGAYELTVTDDNDCELVETYTILSPDELLVTSIVTQPTSQLDGTIELDIIGGVTPYQIYLDQVLVSDFILQGLSAGTYNLEVLDANGCSYQEEIILEIKTSTNTITSLTNFEIYPNPSDGNFELDFVAKQSQTFNLRIYNTLGQQFFQQRMTGKAFRLPIQLVQLPPGIYFLSIRSEEGLAIQKLIIE
ncbi:MAG: CotH kinase family protein [Saprospiraceae bacterium]